MADWDNNGFSIELVLKDFRAIKEAQVLLDGITVVAGENGSGKSTLSQILYYFFKTSTSYNQLVARRFWDAMDDVISLLSAYEHDKSFPSVGCFSRLLDEIGVARDKLVLSDSICGKLITVYPRTSRTQQGYVSM